MAYRDILEIFHTFTLRPESFLILLLFDIRDLVPHEFISMGQTDIKKYYLSVLRRLSGNIRRKRALIFGIVIRDVSKIKIFNADSLNENFLKLSGLSVCSYI